MGLERKAVFNSRTIPKPSGMAFLTQVFWFNFAVTMSAAIVNTGEYLQGQETSYDFGQHHHHAIKTIEPIYGPQPYKFGYKIEDHYGNQYREEKSDEHNNKIGSYGYHDAHGIYRRVHYVADAHGFRATVHTNEPGTRHSHPADAKFEAPVGIEHHYHQQHFHHHQGHYEPHHGHEHQFAGE